MRALGPQPGADDARVAASVHAHGACRLASEEHAILDAPRTIVALLAEGIAGVDDDLRVAVRRNRLGGDGVRGALEPPEPLDDRVQRGRRTILAIDHGAVCLVIPHTSVRTRRARRR